MTHFIKSFPDILKEFGHYVEFVMRTDSQTGKSYYEPTGSQFVSMPELNQVVDVSIGVIYNKEHLEFVQKSTNINGQYVWLLQNRLVNYQNQDNCWRIPVN